MPTPAQLKSALQSKFSASLGTYTFSGTQTTPAIRVDDGSDPFDEEPSISGLEIVIVPSPEIAIQSMLGGYRDTVTTTVVLKQWDITKTTMGYRSALLEVVAGFDDLLLVSGSMRRVISLTKLDNIETLAIQVSQSEWVEE